MSEISFRKPRRNYRERKDDSDEEKITEINKETTGSLQIPQKVSTLSFGDDIEESETFKIKRSSHNRRVVKQLKEGKSLPNTSEHYDSTALPALERGIKSSTSHPNKISELAHESSNILPTKLSNPSSSSDQLTSVFKDGVIPDANAIHLARKQRQKAKFQLESEEDRVISSPPPVNKNDGRRLIREDDDDDEIDDDSVSNSLGIHLPTQRRPAFQVSEYRDPNAKRVEISRGLHRRETEMRIIREDFIAAEHASDRDSDQETEWEHQQIKKAISNQNSVVLDALQPIPAPIEATAKVMPDTQIELSDITLSSLKVSLQARQRKLTASVNENKDLLVAARSDLTRGQTVVQEARASLPDKANNLSFYLRLREYIQDVIDCFNEKITKLNYLDRRSVIILRERFANLVARRRTDMKDIAEEVAIASSSSDIKEDSKSAELRKRRKADREARRLRRKRGRELLQRNAPSTEVMSHEDYKKYIKTITGLPLPQDGVSTDEDESQAVIAKRKSDLNDVNNDANSLFDDVVEEYCTLPAILKYFADWRSKSPETYANAYAALCIPQLISPIIRIQMVMWNPLENDCKFIDEQTWFGCLIDYSVSIPRPEEDTDESTKTALTLLSTSPEQELSVIPNVIEKIILSRLTEIVLASWDPMSTRQSNNLVKIVRSFAALWPTVNSSSKPTKCLFDVILKRMELTIQEDVFIPLYSKQVLTNLQSAGFIFFNRQLNSAMKLLSNLMRWQDLIASEALQHVILTCLVNRYILVGLANIISACSLPLTTSCADSVERILLTQVANRLKAVIGKFPHDWITEDPSSLNNDRMSQFRRFVNELVKQLTLNSTTAPQVAMKSIIKKLVRIQSLMKNPKE